LVISVLFLSISILYLLAFHAQNFKLQLDYWMPQNKCYNKQCSAYWNF